MKYHLRGHGSDYSVKVTIEIKAVSFPPFDSDHHSDPAGVITEFIKRKCVWRLSANALNSLQKCERQSRAALSDRALKRFSADTKVRENRHIVLPDDNNVA
jgi:hypothetical protein